MFRKVGQEAGGVEEADDRNSSRDVHRVNIITVDEGIESSGCSFGFGFGRRGIRECLQIPDWLGIHAHRGQRLFQVVLQDTAVWFWKWWQVLDSGWLYVLDPAANAIWIYSGFSSNFDQVPVSYFDDMPVKLQQAIDLAVSKDELFRAYLADISVSSLVNPGVNPSPHLHQVVGGVCAML